MTLDDVIHIAIWIKNLNGGLFKEECEYTYEGEIKFVLLDAANVLC